MKEEEYNNDYKRRMEAEMVKKAATLNYMTREARERFNNVKLAHPEVADEALMVILDGVRRGRVRMIDDPALKSILTQIINKKR